MESDSESQDSDEGRRFRFETTRKDAVSNLHFKSRISPGRSRHMDRRSRSRDRISRSDKSRHSKDDSFHKSRSISDRDSNSKHSAKEKNFKRTRSKSRDSSSKRPQDKESRTHRIKDSKGSELRESVKNSKDYSNSKHKSKSRDKHKKRSRDRSREKNNHTLEIQEIFKEENKILSEIFCKSMEKEEIEEQKQKNVVKEMESSSSFKEISNIKSQVSETKEISPPRKKTKSFFDRVVNKKINDDSSVYGPVLPPQLEKKLINAKTVELETVNRLENVKELHSDSIIDTIQIIGPTLPSIISLSIENNNSAANEKEVIKINFKEEEPVQNQEGQNNTKKQKGKKETEIEKDKKGTFGPALPPSMKRSEIVGPELPKNFILLGDTCNATDISISDNEDDNHFVGPLPADHPAARDSDIQMKLEHRAKYLKERFKDKTSPEKNKREEWMVELPPAHAVALGLGTIPRKFKTKEGPDLSDRSTWTDTPADRLRKQKEKVENRFVPSEESSNKSKKSKDKNNVKESVEEAKVESLLEMHLKTLKKKKKKLGKEAKELGLPTRRPFDREIDLQVNHLDDVKKKKIFEKASRLNDRFTSGKI